MKHTINLFSLAMVFALIVTALGITPALAITPNIITVTTAADKKSKDGYCSLREAITNANSGGQLYTDAGECGAGGGSVEIDFSPTLSGKTITLTSALPIISTSMNFYSPVKVTISGAGKYRPFFIESGVVVQMTNLTFIKGNAGSSAGGAIFNYGNLTIQNSTFSGNKALNGGAIANSGTGVGGNASLTVVDSTFLGNSATYDGGAILMTSDADGNSTVSISNSTIAGNKSSDRGGGITEYGVHSSLVLLNDTLSGNSASSYGGGLYANAGGSMSAINTVIANSVEGGDCMNYQSSVTVNVNSNNLVEDGSCFSAGTNFHSGDPMLGPLTDNGGTTLTMFPASNSPLNGAGLATICAAAPMNNYDQRGWLRHSPCNIGSVEYYPTSYVSDGGFETYASSLQVPDGWKATNFNPNDGNDAGYYEQGGHSIKMTGNGKAKTLTQTILLTRPAGDYFTFSFWVAGNTIPATGICKAQVLFYMGTMLKSTKTVNCPTGSYGFAQQTLAFNTSAPFTKMVVKFTYSKSSGTVWFDNVSLSR